MDEHETLLTTLKAQEAKLMTALELFKPELWKSTLTKSLAVVGDLNFVDRDLAAIRLMIISSTASALIASHECKGGLLK